MEIASRHNQVLQILPALETGGAERMVVHLAIELMKAGVQTSVVSFFDAPGSQLEHALRSDGVPVWTLGKRRGLDLAMIGRLRKLLCALQPKVIHTHLSALRYAVLALLGITHPPRIIHTIHRVAERDSEFGLRWVQRWCLRRGVEVIAVSEEVAKSCARVYRDVEVPVIPNGIPIRDRAWPSGSRAETRRALGLDQDCFVFCCVAHLRPVKNHKALLKAFAGIVSMDAHLLLAGDGELRSELEALARALGIAEQTHFLGEREDIAEVLAASDAFVLSSVSEGSPLSVLEAMAAGLPIIATSVGGLPELVRSDIEGWLVSLGSIDALQHAMARMVSDRDCRQAMSQAARERATTRFGAGVMAQSYISAYDCLEIPTGVGNA